MTERDRAARRRLVWLLLRRGDLGAEELRSDGLPALRGPAHQAAPRDGDLYRASGSVRSASASSKRASESSRRSPNSSRNCATR